MNPSTLHSFFFVFLFFCRVLLQIFLSPESVAAEDQRSIETRVQKVRIV